VNRETNALVCCATTEERSNAAIARMNAVQLTFTFALNHRHDLSTWLLVSITATVLDGQAEAIVRSLTNMAAADSNGYLKSNYMLNIDNRRTKHYTYSYIHVRSFTKTEPVSKQSHDAAMFVGEASRRLQRLLLF